MIWIVAVVLALATTATEAATLTLGCSGKLTSTDVPKDNVASDPKAEKIVDFSVVVDFDRQNVSGFWTQMNGVHDLIPIIAVDANSVTFRGRKKEPPVEEKSIEGTVDRITGKIDAFEIWVWRTGNLSNMTWDLQCRPTKPLF